MDQAHDALESLLSTRLFLAPQLAAGRIFFVSDLGGRLSLYSMDARPGGSVPEPLLPPGIALMNPHLMGGEQPFVVLERLGRILVLIDRDGDEAYQPFLVPIAGGFPEPAFGGRLAGHRVRLFGAYPDRDTVYIAAESQTGAETVAFRGDVATGELVRLGASAYGCLPVGVNADHTRVALLDGYTAGDYVLYLWRADGPGDRELLYGVPLEARAPGAPAPPLNGIADCRFTPGDRALLCVTALFDDRYGLGYLPLEAGRAAGGDVRPVSISGARHRGEGELTGLNHAGPGRFRVSYNIDGCSWLYEGAFDEERLEMRLDRVICGEPPLAGGVLEQSHRDAATGTYALSFSTATRPTGLYTVPADPARAAAGGPVAHTRERVLGLSPEALAEGEDASFTSFDGLRISARLYRPAPALGFAGPRPVVYYIHGGPQSQEQPNFAWFSMPLIQLLTLRGFAVFVPNARGSSGYGLGYMRRVERDWGGQDRLDHVHAVTAVLPRDERLDARRLGVVGRSYGGYMTLTLAARHPELWSAAIDMFGPYDLRTFHARVPESWRPSLDLSIGNPERDRDHMIERSPSTHIDSIRCPLLVIQGANDMRVVECESRDVVERLRARGRDVEYTVFEDEGHDVLKRPNKLRCYGAIASFFAKHLRP